ncbi:hypothetical protein DD592_27370, partial [Enterobacter cloacae complex sp. 2DZ2F20B]
CCLDQKHIYYKKCILMDFPTVPGLVTWKYFHFFVKIVSFLEFRDSFKVEIGRVPFSNVCCLDQKHIY